MGNNYFKFKQFTVYQDNVTMRVNTDGALLGAWCNVEGAQRVLDVGTGTGVIALMVAQRKNLPFVIDAIDIDSESCFQAHRNFEQSKWKESLNVFHQSLQEFTQKSIIEKHGYAGKYDLIVSNPPYFVNSLKNPSAKKTLARHTDLLPYNDLITCTVQLLGDNGRFSLILPSDQVQGFAEQAQRQGLFVQRSCSVFAKAEDKKPKRVLIEFVKPKVSKTATPQDRQERITIMANGNYTEEFRSLLKDFYLHF